LLLVCSSGTGATYGSVNNQIPFPRGRLDHGERSELALDDFVQRHLIAGLPVFLLMKAVFGTDSFPYRADEETVAQFVLVSFTKVNSTEQPNVTHDPIAH
jgi:hypothetical protein